MPRLWSSSFFACLWTRTKSRSLKTQKRTRLISRHITEQAWSIKDLTWGKLIFDVRGIENDLSRNRKPKKKSNCVCGAINP